MGASTSFCTRPLCPHCLDYLADPVGVPLFSCMILEPTLLPHMFPCFSFQIEHRSHPAAAPRGTFRLPEALASTPTRQSPYKEDRITLSSPGQPVKEGANFLPLLLSPVINSFNIY